MNTIFKPVFHSPCKQVHEGDGLDKRWFTSFLKSLRDAVQWELETPPFQCDSDLVKTVLHYDYESGMWMCTFALASTGGYAYTEHVRKSLHQYRDYNAAFTTFKNYCEIFDFEEKDLLKRRLIFTTTLK